MGQVVSRPCRRHKIAVLLLAAVLAGPSSPAGAISDRVVHDVFTGIAIGGFDPVAYFIDHTARPGKRTFELKVDGSFWNFVNEGNMAAFRQSPQVYAPAYGGYGAGAVASGRLTPGNPLIWAIYHDRLYLFFSEDERTEWLADPNGFIREANIRWTDLVKTLAPD